MKCFIRADSSTTIGLGHVMRCLTLADMIRKSGGTVSFIIRNLQGHLGRYIEGKEYTVHLLTIEKESHTNSIENNHQAILPCQGWQRDAEETQYILSKEQDADWVVVDHYGLDAEWEASLRNRVKKILVIDDLANRRHDCDILLDQNLYGDMKTRYKELVPDHCLIFLGPRYVLLRNEFMEARKKIRDRSGIVRRVLIFFGGSDPFNITTKTINALLMLKRSSISADVVVGSANPHKEQVRELCEALPNVTYHCQIDNMAELMVRADLCIGSGGATTWERCYMGLPTITINYAQNQENAIKELDKTGIIWNLGWHDDVTEKRLSHTILKLIDQPALLIEMSNRSLQIVETDSDGSPVVKAMFATRHA